MRTIGIFIYEDFQILDATGPTSAFELAARAVSPPAYQIRLLSRDGGLVRSSSGVTFTTLALDDAGPNDTLIVVGGNGVDWVLQDARTLGQLRDQASTLCRLCSVCSGAMLLAQAGLLDGHRATTHWSRTSEFTRRFPSVRLEPDNIFVRSGNIWTSAGISAGIDLALALIAADLGEGIARAVAREMVVYYRRPGGQSQFSALQSMACDDDRFVCLLAWIRQNIGERLTVDVLADKAVMSPRHFARAFSLATGVSPAKAVERLRLEVARERVESSDRPIEQIAAEVGFHDPERMRRAFIRTFGMPAQAFRRVAKTGKERR